MNYETILDNLLIQLLAKMYGVKNEETAYRIFFIRFLIENNNLYKKTNISNYELKSKMPDFLISELNLPLIEGNVYYKNERLLTYPDSKNSLTNILDNWFFRYADTFALDNKGDVVLNLFLIEKEIKNIFKRAEKSIDLKKRDSRYSVHFKKACLDILKATYKISPEPVGRIDGFSYPVNHNDFKLTLDEKYDRLVHADNLYTKSIKGLTEDILEDYLIRNLHLIEDGMQFISRQFTVENGRLDILARDKNGIPCVIELKTGEDADLIFQSVYYRLKIKERFKTNHVRMITVAPYYPSHIKESLEALKDVEMYIFDAKVKNKKIIDLKLIKSA